MKFTDTGIRAINLMPITYVLSDTTKHELCPVG